MSRKKWLKNSSVPRFEVPESRFADYLEQSVPVYPRPGPFTKSASPIAVPSPDTPTNLPAAQNLVNRYAKLVPPSSASLPTIALYNGPKRNPVSGSGSLCE